MTLRYSAPTALEYFATLVQSDEHFPLLEAAANCQCYSVLLEAVPAYYGMCLKRAERLTGSADLLPGL